jgi:pSer/pThr/pTyr-binding forkhead associated (FHA) protein
MSGPILLILRVLLAGVLYAFLGWIVLILWRDLQRQGELLAARQPLPLILTLGGAAPRKFTTPQVVLGRDTANDFPLDDPTVSTQHARLSYHHNQWWAEDLRSTNGTTLNDEPVIASVVLTDGDELHCGAVKIKVEFGPRNP